ncbi:MAG: GTP-binding protein [Candidatus Harrisonbacteria bacterium]|nr:GTP-binding protein [Candidatus Harrisonbacteria bacterium]
MKKIAVAFLLLVVAASVVALFLHEQGSRAIEVLVEQMSAPLAIITPVDPNADISPQPPLSNPPSVIKAAYVTSWAAGSNKKMAYVKRLLEETELNAVVIDVKDYTGVISYDADLADAKRYGATERRIPRINALIKELHDAGVYVIARIAVFEDQRLPLAHPEWALQSKKTGKQWRDYKGLMWMDPGARGVWDYTIAIAKDALARGFDEVNLDYIRFASDGELADVRYPVWDGKTPKKETMRQFFAYVRQAIPDAKLSADLFGMTTTNNDDLNIGQYLEYAMPYFDAIAPMVYPSHYTSGFIGITHPARAPYDVVRYSLSEAIKRMKAYIAARDTALATIGAANVSAGAMTVPLPLRAKLRPWLQDFNLGATYDAEKIQAQIRATTDAARECADTCDGLIHDEAIDGRFIGGWMLWNAGGTYTEEALRISD